MSPTLVFVFALCVGYATATCSIRHRYMSTPQPLLLNTSRPFLDVRRFVGDASGYAYVESGRNVTLVCPGAYNYLTGGGIPLLLQRAVAVCDGTSFSVDGKKIAIDSVVCYATPQTDVRVNLVNSSLTCGDSTLPYEVGFALAEGFLRTYELCFHHRLQTPLSARHLVLPGTRNSGTFKMSVYIFGAVDPVVAYDRNAQLLSLTEQLGSESATKYITSYNYFRSKLLVPSEDFIHISPQSSVYFYFNTVPLWKLFAEGYWSTMESAIRTLSNTEGVLEIYTGVHGVAELYESHGEKKPVYLYSASPEKAIPIPAMLSKSVRNSQNEEVIFIQALNKGDKSRSNQVQRLCAEDVCAQLRWLPWAQVPAAQRPVACCAPTDANLRRIFPMQRLAASGAAKGLLVGRA